MNESEIDNEMNCRLADADANVIDGFFAGNPATESTRAIRAESLLGLLRLSGVEDDAIAALRADRITEASSVAARLSEAGERVVDSFADGHEPAEGVRVLELLDDSVADDESPRHERIERVMTAIRERDADVDTDPFRLSPPSADEVRSTRRIRFSDLVAVAAVLLVGTAILFPSLFSAQSMAEEIQCAQNMQRAGLGFSLFANDHDGRLPATSEVDGPEADSSPDARWWLVGGAAGSHSANLFVLVREDYVPLEALACPGNARAAVTRSPGLTRDWQNAEQLSYSYQLFDGAPPRFSDPGIALVLADRSPVVAAAMQGESVDATLNSRNHGERGQNVLLPDFSVFFLHSPRLADGDNIWIPRSRENQPRSVRLDGTERPATRDAFVGP